MRKNGIYEILKIRGNRPMFEKRRTDRYNTSLVYVSLKNKFSYHRQIRFLLRREYLKCDVATYRNTRITNCYGYRTELASRLGKLIRNMRS